MIRPLAILALSLWACSAGLGQSANDRVRLRATVQAVAPLTSFSGPITPVDVDPRFALTVRIESAVPAVASFTEGAVVTLAIHSPSLLFAGEPTKGKAYEFSLRRKVEDGKVRFFALRIWKVQAAANRSPAGESEGTPILIKSGSINGKVVLVDAEMNGKRVQLECFVSQVECAVPKPGNYLLVKSPAGSSTYMDCPNIDLYEQPTDSKMKKLLAKFCLLGE
jgi:hypothetical protein